MDNFWGSAYSFTWHTCSVASWKYTNSESWRHKLTKVIAVICEQVYLGWTRFESCTLQGRICLFFTLHFVIHHDGYTDGFKTWLGSASHLESSVNIELHWFRRSDVFESRQSLTVLVLFFFFIFTMAGLQCHVIKTKIRSH